MVTLIVLLALSFKKLESTEQGLAYTPMTKKLDEEVKTAGLHLGVPGFKLISFPSVQITEDLPEDTCLS